MAEPLSEIVRLAAAGRVVRLGYRRPGEQAASDYLVEPYRLHRFASGPVVHCWQRSPVPEGRLAVATSAWTGSRRSTTRARRSSRGCP